MTVGWLIDGSDFDSHHQGLEEAIVRNGYVVKAVNRPTPPYGWEDTRNSYRKAFPPGACVVTLADIDLVNRVRADGLWTPGVFATVEHYFCSQYYAHLGRFLLNTNYVMLPFAELARQADFLFDTFGSDDQIFVRPDSPLKIFTGLLASRQTFTRDLEFMAFYEFPIENLVVVSSPKSIVREWRFVVANGSVVAGSQYKEASESIAAPGYDANAFELASAIVASGYAPDPVWVMDICQTTDLQYHLLEIGCFSFASLYGCDKDAVVKAVSEVAKTIHAQSQRRE